MQVTVAKGQLAAKDEFESGSTESYNASYVSIVETTNEIEVQEDEFETDSFTTDSNTETTNTDQSHEDFGFKKVTTERNVEMLAIEEIQKSQIKIIREFSDCGKRHQFPNEKAYKIDSSKEDNETFFELWPWMGSVGFYEGDEWIHQCSGSLISFQYVLTTARCAEGQKLKVKLGETNSNSKKSTTRTAIERDVKKISIHPKFQIGISYYDVAILEIDPSVDFSANARPVCLPRFPSGETNKHDQNYFTYNAWSQSSTSEKIIKSTNLTISSRRNCNYVFTEANKNFCLDEKINKTIPNLFQNQIICGRCEKDFQTDVGGPLVKVIKNKYVQIGIAQSGIKDCNGTDLPKVFVRLDDPEIFNFVMPFVYESDKKVTMIEYSIDDPFGRSFYEGDIINQLAWGKGTLTFRNGNVYIGNMQNDLPHGNGSMIFSKDDELNRLSYTGQWCQNEFVDRSTLIFKNGDVYEGNFHANQEYGIGKLTYSNESLIDYYEGIFTKGEITGYGTMSWRDGRNFTGFFKNGKMSSSGTMNFPDGRTYTGRFKTDEIFGQGRTTFQDGSKHEGAYVDGQQQGFGVLFYPPESEMEKFEGNFDEGKPSGEGILYWKNGEKYVGKFENGQPNGDGETMKRNKTQEIKLNNLIFSKSDEFQRLEYEGEVVDGMAWGSGKLIYSVQSGLDYYVGEMQNGLPHGKGTQIFKEREDLLYKLEGDFIEGKLDGLGVISWTNGKIYEGTVRKSLLDGKGQTTFQPGNSIIKHLGIYRDDYNNGPSVFTYADGYVSEGFCQDSALEGYGTLRFEDNGRYYVGQLKNSSANGQGNLYWPDGEIWQGNFVDGNKNGFVVITYPEDYTEKSFEGYIDGNSYDGTLYYKNGESYIGELKNGEMHGLGTKYFANGLISEQGFWQYGKFID